MSAPRPTRKSSRRAVAWIGPARCAAVRLTPPPLPPAKRRRILPALLGQHIPFPVEECDCAFEPLPDGAVMGFAARRSAVDDVLAEHRAAAEPTCVIPAAWALWLASQRALPPAAPDERRAVLCGTGGTLLAVLGRGDAFETAAELPDAAEAASLALGPDAASTRCLCVGDRAAALADAARAAGAQPTVPADAADFLERACAASAARRDGADLLAGRAPSGPSARLLLAAAAFLAVSAAALFVLSARVLEDARGHSAALEAEFSVRVDTVAGYHVTAKGDRAVSSALAIAGDGAAAPTLALLLSPGASGVLADTLESAAAHGIHVFHLTLGEAGPSLSGDAPDHASLDAFGAESTARGRPLRIEPDPGAVPGERLRFMASPISSTP